MARRRVVDDSTQAQEAPKNDDFPFHDPPDDMESLAAQAIEAAPKIQQSAEDAPRRRRVAQDAPTPTAVSEDAPAGRPAQLGTLLTVGGPVEVGTQVTVTWGKELFSPKQFHTFEVGPFVAIVTTRPGESIAQASDRAMSELSAYAEKERERKRQSYERALSSR